jgi:cysteine synthase
LLSGGAAGTHAIPGFNGGFIAPTTAQDLLDDVIAVSDADALQAAQRLASRVGVLVGVSAGAVVHACGVLANRSAYADKRIVTLLPDTGERYLSMWSVRSGTVPSRELTGHRA